MLDYGEQAMLEIICLHEMGISEAELAYFLTDPYTTHSEAHYNARIVATKHLDTANFSPTLD
jgi:hypothetical protein